MQDEVKLTYPRVYVTYQESSNINATSHTLEGLIIYKIIHTKFAGGRSRMHSILISCQSILSLFSDPSDTEVKSLAAASDTKGELVTLKGN